MSEIGSFERIANAIYELIDSVVIPLGDKLGFPFNFILGGVGGFVKGLIEQILS